MLIIRYDQLCQTAMITKSADKTDLNHSIVLGNWPLEIIIHDNDDYVDNDEQFLVMFM